MQYPFAVTLCSDGYYFPETNWFYDVAKPMKCYDEIGWFSAFTFKNYAHG